jgi:hypothetical protein
MPENRHRDARVNVERGEQRAARPTRVVSLDLPHSGLFASRVETALEVPRLDRLPCASRKQQLMTLAAYADLRPFVDTAVSLVLSCDSQCGEHYWRWRQGFDAAACLELVLVREWMPAYAP